MSAYTPITAAGVSVAEPLDMNTTRSERPVTLSTTVQHRGRTITITATGMTVDQFCDLLDKRSYGTPQSAPAPAAVEKFCPVHGDPMKAMARPDKAGNTHWCTKKVGDGFCKERA